MAKSIQLPHFVDYLKSKNLKRKTIKEYSYYWNKFNMKHFALNMESINDFLSDPNNQNPPCRSFLKNYIRFVKINRKFYEIDDLLYADLIEIELPQLSGREKTRIPRYLTEDQINELEKVLRDEREKLCLLLSYFCGLRLGELVKIDIGAFNWQKWKDSNFEDYCEVRVFGKGDKEGIALIPTKLMKRISNYVQSKKWLIGQDRIFLYSQKLTNIDTQVRRWQMKLREAGVKSGISKIGSDGKIIEGTQVHPHLLRHSYGALLIARGVDIRKIQELLRHTSINTTQIYTHLNKDQLKEELKDKNIQYDGEIAQKDPNTPTEQA